MTHESSTWKTEAFGRYGMTLQIRIIKAAHSASLAQNHHIFDESGGTVGRGPGNTWVLPDPERILSSRHCEFVFEGGCYHLIDLSTNGTFINGSPERSEEHTSELQSRGHLVCRLLLEKKKNMRTA